MRKSVWMACILSGCMIISAGMTAFAEEVPTSEEIAAAVLAEDAAGSGLETGEESDRMIAAEETCEDSQVIPEIVAEPVTAEEERTEAAEAEEVPAEEKRSEEMQAAENDAEEGQTEETGMGSDEIPEEGIQVQIDADSASASGTSGTLSWAVYGNTLQFTGSGVMGSYFSEPAPWQAFAEDITEVSLPAGIISIGNSAFANMVRLERVNLPEGLKEIGWHAFEGCSALKSIHIPSSVEFIGHWAFDSCSSLTDASFGGGKQQVSQVLFSGNAPLLLAAGYDLTFSGTSVDLTWTFDGTVLKLSGSGEMRRYASYESALLMAGNEVSPWCFLNSFVKKLVLAPVAEITSCAFMDLSALTSVVIPDGVEVIGTGAFYGCTALKTVYIPKSVKSLMRMSFSDQGKPGSAAHVIDVYYEGSEEEWQNVQSDSNNLIDQAIMHFGSSPEESEEKAHQLSVSGLKAAPAGMMRVNLAWNKTEGAAGYLILRGGKQIGYSVTNTYTDGEANAEDFNYYWVIPFTKKDGKIVKGALSNYVWALGRTVGSIEKVTASGTKGGVSLSWAAAQGANGYVILSKTGSNKAAFNAPVRTSVPSYTDTAASGTVKFYWVYAVYNGQSGNTMAAGKVSPFAWAVAK